MAVVVVLVVEQTSVLAAGRLLCNQQCSKYADLYLYLCMWFCVQGELQASQADQPLVMCLFLLWLSVLNEW